MKRLKDVGLFVIICFGFTYALYLCLYLLGGLSCWAAMPILLISMFIPLISTYIVIRLKLHGRLRDFGLKPAKQRRYYLYALLYPFLILGIGLLLVAIFQTAPIVSSLEEFKRNLLTVPLSRLQPTTPVNELPAEALDIVFYLTLFSLSLAPFINAIPAFGEEYGWRGLLLDRLIADTE